MKLKDLPRALGFRSAPREYGYEILTFPLSAHGDVRFARWLHPGETPKSVTEASVDALRMFLREGDVAIDIGAHTGDSTLPVALAVGASGTVFALEPNPYVFKVLAVNAMLNPLSTRIVPLMFAAMPADGEFEFEYSDAGYCNGGFHQGLSPWKHGHFSTLRVEGRNCWVSAPARSSGTGAAAPIKIVRGLIGRARRWHSSDPPAGLKPKSTTRAERRLPRRSAARLAFKCENSSAVKLIARPDPWKHLTSSRPGRTGGATNSLDGTGRHVHRSAAVRHAPGSTRVTSRQRRAR